MSYKSLSKGLDACKVVVTGGAGLIGSSLVSRLRSIGVEVYAFDSQDFIDSSIYNATLDLLDPNFLRYLDDIQPSIVVHTAAHPGGKSFREPVEDVRVNSYGSIGIFEWCMKNNSRIVYLSSSVIYGLSEKGKILNEADNLDPLTVYGVSKLACEKWLKILSQNSRPNWTILRLFSTYGAGHKPSLEQGLINVIMTQILQGGDLTIKGSLERIRDLIYVEDVVTAIVKTLEIDETIGQIINIASGRPVQIIAIIKIICEELNKDFDLLNIKVDEGTVGDPFSNVADITKMNSMLDFIPSYSLEQGIKATIQGLRYNQNWK
jgi:UDP-glucose 4-epimerase